ncbi:lipoprotein N-acyltransferase Lnb domain-containing protein [Helicobacter sp. T3_23-1056]
MLDFTLSCVLRKFFRIVPSALILGQCFLYHCFADVSLLATSQKDFTKDSNLKTKSTQNLSNDLLNPLFEKLLALPIYATQEWRTLLHYGKYKSSIHKTSPFFLHKKGHKNPKSEYEATLQKLFAQNLNTIFYVDSNANFYAESIADFSEDSNAESIACAYPARMQAIKKYITQNANIYGISDEWLRIFEKMIDTSKCSDLQDFLDIVPLEKVFIEFAAESDIYPGSSMGHLFLHLQGTMQKDIKRVFDDMPFSRTKGQIQDYSMSYYATMSEFFNPLDYIRAIVGNLKGYYALSPYASTASQYLNDDKRSIYRYEVKASKEDLGLFALHLWELKDKQIKYSFIKHNCTNGIEKILGVLDLENIYHSKKLFSTPAQYLQHLEKKEKIGLDEVLLPERKKSFVKKFGTNKVLESYKNSKISFGYSYPNMAFLSFYPIYSDIKNADNAYKEFIESRILSLQAGLAMLQNSRGQTYAKGFLSKIELLHLHSINDTIRTRQPSKLLNISFLPNFYDYDKATKTYAKEPNHQTRLYPNINLGLGFGTYGGNQHYQIAFFALPFLEYRYEIIHNVAFGLKSGFIAKIPRAKIVADYTMYYDMVKNNRGFDSGFSLFLGISVYKNVDLFVEGALYHNLFSPHNYQYGRQISYQKNEFFGLKSGISVNF